MPLFLKWQRDRTLRRLGVRGSPPQLGQRDQKVAQPAEVQRAEMCEGAVQRAEVREGAVHLRQEPPLVFTTKFSHEAQ